MVLKKLFGGLEEEAEEDSWLEVSTIEESRIGRLGVKVDTLNEFSDTERILKALRDGSIVFLKIKNLREKDLGELKRAVEKLKKSVLANNGDIAGIEQDWLILTPEFASIQRD